MNPIRPYWCTQVLCKHIIALHQDTLQFTITAAEFIHLLPGPRGTSFGISLGAVYYHASSETFHRVHPWTASADQSKGSSSS